MSATVRVFISSTFADFAAEREALHQHVFPRMRARARAAGVQLQLVDLRWGISPETARRHGTLETCLREVRRCRLSGARPFLIALVGDRYGWCPPPDRLAQVCLLELLCLASEPERALLLDPEHGYRLDENALPAEYVLSPASQSGPSLRAALAALASRAGWAADDARRLRLTASATHQELVAAVEGAGSLGGVLCLFRDIEGLPTHAIVQPWSDDNAAAVAGMREWLARATQQVPVVLRTRWLDGAPAPDHLPVLCDRVCGLLQAAVDAAAGIPVDGEAAHATLVAEVGGLLGRAAEIAAVERLLAGGPSRPVVIGGSRGSGRTALLAQVAASARKRRPTDRVVFRSVGATPNSVDAASLLGGICREIGAFDGRSPATGLLDLRAALHARFRRATAEQEVVVIVDGVDRLQGLPFGTAFLPTRLPQHARALVSVDDGPADLDLGPLPPEAAGELLDRTLAESGRSLQPGQRAAILASIGADRRPAPLRALAEVAAGWRSWEDRSGDDCDPRRTRAALAADAAAEHGACLTRRTLSYLSLARNGLSEPELLDVLSNDDSVAAELAARYPLAPITGRIPDAVWIRFSDRIGPLLLWKEVGGARLACLRDPDAGEGERLDASDTALLHARLCEIFRPVNAGVLTRRSASEWPWHLTRSGRADEACRLILDPAFLSQKLAFGLYAEVLADGEDAATAAADSGLRATVSQLVPALRDERANLEGGVAPDGLSFEEFVHQQLTNRLAVESRGGSTGLSDPKAAGIRLLRRPPWPGHLSARVIPLARDERVALGGCVRFSPDGRWVVATTVSGDCVALDPATGEVVARYRGPGVARCIDFSADGDDVVVGGFTVTAVGGVNAIRGGFIATFDFQTGAPLRAVECGAVWKLVVTAADSVVASELQLGSRSAGTSAEAVIVVRDLETLSSERALRGLRGSGGPALAIDPSRRLVAAGENHDADEAARIIVWDASTWRELTAFEGPKFAVTSLRFSPDALLLASGSTHLNCGVVVWSWRCPGCSLDSALLDPRRRDQARELFAQDRGLRLASRVASVLETAETVADLAFLPNLGWLAAVEGSSPRGPVALDVYEVVGDRPGNVGKLTAGLRLPLSVDADAHGRWLAVLDAGREVRLWPTQELRTLPRVPPPQVLLAPTSDSNLRILACRTEGGLHLTDLCTGQGQGFPAVGRIVAAAIDPTGTAIGQVWRTPDGGAIYSIHEVEGLAICPEPHIAWRLPELERVVAVVPGPGFSAGAVLFEFSGAHALFRHSADEAGTVVLKPPFAFAPTGAFRSPDGGLVFLAHRAGADLLIDVHVLAALAMAEPAGRIRLAGVTEAVPCAGGFVGFDGLNVTHFSAQGSLVSRRTLRHAIVALAASGGHVAVADTSPSIQVLALPSLHPVANCPTDRPCRVLFLDATARRLVAVGASPEVDRPDLLRFELV